MYNEGSINPKVFVYHESNIISRAKVSKNSNFTRRMRMKMSIRMRYKLKWEELE